MDNPALFFPGKVHVLYKFDLGSYTWLLFVHLIGHYYITDMLAMDLLVSAQLDNINVALLFILSQYEHLR